MKVGIDCIGVSAGAVIINQTGKFFLAKRGPGARDDVGMWEFPGGTIEFFETRIDAVRRIILKKHDFAIVIDGELGVYDVIDRANNDHWISTTYICRPASDARPRIVNIKKSTEIGWFTYEELLRLELSRITKLNVGDLAIKHHLTGRISSPK